MFRDKLAEIWIDDEKEGKICVGSWHPDVPLTADFPPVLWDAVGGFMLNGFFMVVPTWIEFWIDGEVKWRKEVSPDVLKAREKMAGEEEARRQSRPDDIT